MKRERKLSDLQKRKKLYAVYKTVISVTSDRELNKLGLTLPEFNCLPEMVTDIFDNGYCYTFIESLKSFFEKRGFTIVNDDLNFYKIYE